MTILAPAVWIEGCAEALGTLRRHPLRAALASLAMAAAVATTAVVQTGLNELARSARENAARAFGSDAFVITRVASSGLSRRALAERIERNPNITRGDVRFLERAAGDRVLYAAIAQRPADIRAGSRRFENATVNGTQSTLFDIRDVGLARGRAFTRDEEIRGAQVVVAGHAVAEELFQAADPLGQVVRIGGRGFRIVGIQAEQGTAGGVSLDRYVWMPLAAFERVFGAPASLQIFARAGQASRTAAAEDRAWASMRARRRLDPGAPDTFDIITPEASRTFVATVTARVGAAAPPISLMALIVALMVVTNTTLVSVTQRTRETGIRRAVGATRASVLIETLAESTVIAVAGGLLGLAGAAGLLSLASGALDVPLSLARQTAVASLATAGLSGIVAGWYPARRAAGLEVVRALGYE